MTAALAILAAWTLASIPVAMVLGRIIHTGTPSPCERDAQDGRGEAGEGAGAGAFHSGSNHIQERSNHG